MNNPEFNRILAEVPECSLLLLDVANKPTDPDGNLLAPPESGDLRAAENEIRLYTRGTSRLRLALRDVMKRGT